MKQILVVIAALGGLVACSPALHTRVADRVQSDVREAEDQAAAQKQPTVYQVREQPWVAGEPVALEPAAPRLPGLDQVVSYGHGPGGNLVDAAHYLSASSGVRIRVTPDAAALFVTENGPTGFEFETTTAPLEQVLDSLTSRTGTSWKIAGDGIAIYYYDTRTYSIEVQNTDVESIGVITNASGVGGGQGGGAGGGSGGGSGTGGGVAQSSVTTDSANQQTMNIEYALRFYDDVAKTIEAMLTENGKVSVSRSASSVTVRDTAAVLESVEAYIGDLNSRMSRQVVIEMTVLTVDLGDSDEFGIDWNLVKRGVGDMTLSAINLGNSSVDAGQIGATVVDPTNLYNGSQVIVRALREQVNATVKRVTNVHGMNNQPVRVQTAFQAGYVQSVSTTLVQDVGAQVDFQTAYQVTGFSLTLVPLILDDGDVLLQVQGGISAPQGLRQVSVGDDLSVEIPNTSNDDFFQRARLKQGSTLVLTTLDQSTNTESGKGVGSARFPLLGGSRRADQDRRMLVILLSPRLVG